ncbi:hypothetical protein [uncultured Pontibacter sp.]|uniref:hypothetical protein n=1 Tax=uncultured Pontibacter sp. TaxID=453356 RepID=UPI002620B553|nr:hypothetical protein [uncultured Pontibacter sp.]
MSEFKKEITIKANDQLQAQSLFAALQTIANNIEPDNLLLLAQKSKTFGINFKIRQFKHLI